MPSEYSVGLRKPTVQTRPRSYGHHMTQPQPGYEHRDLQPNRSYELVESSHFRYIVPYCSTLKAGR